MPRTLPSEFKRDVVAIARRGQLTRTEIASDFGISETILRRWLRQGDIDDGRSDGVTSAEQDELVQLRRARIPEQENETLRRAAAHVAKDSLQNDLPAGSRPVSRRRPRPAQL